MSYSDRSPANRNRLYRDKDRAILFGVCAGLADWLGFNLAATRIVTLLLAIPFTAVVVIGYIALAILLPAKPSGMYRDPEDEAFWREVRRAPADSVGYLNRRFRELDERIQRMEAWVTSSRYRIDRELGA